MAKCAVNTKLYQDLKNDNSREYSTRANSLFGFIEGAMFKEWFGDWQQLEDIEARKRLPSMKGKLDEDGNPKIEFIKEFFEKNDIGVLSKLPYDFSNTGDEHINSELEPENKGILDIMTRIARRVQSLKRSTKIRKIQDGQITAELGALEHAAEQSGDYTRVNEYRQQLLSESYLNELEDLKRTLANANAKTGYKEYFQSARRLLNQIEQTLKVSGAVNIKVLDGFHKKMRFYEGIQDVINLLEQKEQRVIRKYVTQDNDGGKAIDYKSLIVKVNSINKQLQDKSIELLAEKMGSEPGVVYGAYRLKKDTEYKVSNPLETFRANNPDLSKRQAKKIYEEQKDKAIQEYLDENTGFGVDTETGERTPRLITKEEIENVKNLLNHDPQDISKLTAWLVDPRNLHETMIAHATDLLDKADYMSMRKTINMSVKMNQLVNDFYTHVKTVGVIGKDGKKITNTLNMEEVYYRMVAKDKDGNLTRNLTSRFMQEVWDTKAELYDTMRSFEEEDYTSEEYEEALQEYNLFISTNFTADRIPIKKWENPDFNYFLENKNSPDVKLFWHLNDMKVEINEFYLQPDFGALEIASIEKSGMEQAFEKGVLFYVKETLGDFYKIRGTDIDEHDRNIIAQDQKELSEIEKWSDTKKYIHGFLDENGKAERNIPIYYRRGDLVDIDQQSFDLASVFMLDYYGGVNFNHKNEIKPELDILKGAVANRKSAPNLFGKKMMQRIPITKNMSKVEFAEQDGDKSNLYEALESLLEDRLYGMRTIGAGPMAQKIASSVMGWTGDVMLIGNLFSALASVFHSRSLQTIQGIAGRYYGVDFNITDIIQAEKKYDSNLFRIVGDFSKIRPGAITNLLGERFTANQEWSPVGKRFMAATGLSRMWKKNSLHALHGMGEHYVQHILMYSYLNAIKIKNKSGKYIDKSGKEVESREKAMSFDEIYDTDESQKKGKLIVRKGLELGSAEWATGNMREESISELGLYDVEYQINQAIGEMNYDINGNYSYNNQSKFSRHITGKFVNMMKKWVVPGTLKRYRGMRTLNPFASTPRSAIRDNDRHWSKHRKDFKYAEYLEMTRFVKDVFSSGEALKFKLISTRFHTLTNREKAAVHKAVTEFAFMAGNILISALVTGLAADERDKTQRRNLYIIAFFTRRLYSELAFYANPLEAFRIIRNPAASLNLVENILEFLWQGIGDITTVGRGGTLDRYKRGKRRGKTKLGKEFNDLVPGVGHLDRTFEDAHGWLTKDGLFQ